MASIISMKALLESGVHFGHRTNKWNPAMRPYIFTERNGIHIIDLQQTVKSLTQVYQLISKTVAEGGTVLFVGTKRQAQETIKEEAMRCGMPYVTERWLPGTLTNWVTIFDRIQEMERLERMHETGEIERITKKEALLVDREITRLNIRLNGIRNMKRLPELVFIVDVMREDTAVLEANSKDIPVIALVDTNCDPGGVDYVIPSNDDAIRAIKLLVGKVADAVLEGKAMRKDEESEAESAEAAGLAAPAARIPRRQMLEEEVDDESLLGESTLAKLTGRVDLVEEVEAEVVAAEVETKEVKTRAKAVKAETVEVEPEVVEAEVETVEVEPEVVEAEAETVEVEPEVVEAEAETVEVEPEVVEAEVETIEVEPEVVEAEVETKVVKKKAKAVKAEAVEVETETEESTTDKSE